MVAVQDESSRFTTDAAINALKRVGAVDPVRTEYRGSFALAGYGDADNKRPLWITQKVGGRKLGPSEVSSRIPLTPFRRKEI